MADFNDWSISSSTDTELSGVTPGGSPGEYIFIPPNDREKNIYTIMYSHNGVTGKTEYIVSSADCYTDECATSLVPPTVCFDPNQPQYDEQDSCIAMTVSHEPGNVKTIFTLGKCWKFIGTSYPAQISNVTTDAAGGTSTIYYKQNSEERNIESVITYKFKNETANVTGQSDVTIIQEPNPCITATCANAPTLSKNPTTKVPSTGDTVTISYSSLGECWRVDSKKIREGYEQYATLDDNNVVHVNPNTSRTEDTSIMVDYVFVNKATNYPCPKDVEIIQEGVDPCKIDHECPTVQGSDTYEVSAAGASGADAIKITYSPEKNSCWTLAVTSGGDTNQIDSIVTGISSTTITVKSNTDGSTKTMTVTFTFTNSLNGEQCGKTITITQAAGCVCSDIYFTYAGHDVNFSVNEVNTWTKVGEITVTKNSCIDSVGVTSITEGLTVQAVPNGTNKKDVEVKITKFDQYQENGNWVTARKLQFKITLNNQPCGNIYELYQQAFRGTDNGADRYANGEILSDPLFFVGTPGSSDACLQSGVKIACRDYRVGCSDECEGHDCAQYGIDRSNAGKHDADSIICEGGAYFVDDNNPSNTHKIDSTWSGVYLNENGVTDEANGWLFVDASCDQTDTGIVCNSGLCNVGMVRVTVTKNNNTGACRFARFKLASEPDPSRPAKKILSTGCSPTPKHAGEEAAREWYYDIVQIPEGYYLCNYDDKHPENYMITGLTPLTEPCDDCNKEVHGQCRCAYH